MNDNKLLQLTKVLDVVTQYSTNEHLHVTLDNLRDGKKQSTFSDTRQGVESWGSGAEGEMRAHMSKFSW